MKKFIRTFSLVLALMLALSTVAFSAFAAEFTDYYEVPEYIFGDTDFDGKITVRDATALQKHIAKIITLSEDALYFGDANGSGDVTISDATTIQKYVAKIIDVFPVEDYINEYECKADGTVVDIKLTADSSVQVMLTVEEEGFYDVTATAGSETALYFELSSEDMQNFWLGESDGETSYIFAKLTPGVYYAYMYTEDGLDTTVQFKAGLSESEPPFDTEKAVELNIGDKIEVKAGEAPLVYKVDISTLTATGDEMCIYTDGEDPRVTLTCYDGSYCLNSESDYLDDVNSMIAVYDDYVNSIYYVVVEQEEGGSDFTLCCDSSFGIIRSEAEDIELGTADEMEVLSYTEDYGEEILQLNVAEALYRFTPEESGYYSFNFESDAPMYVTVVIADLDAVDDSYLFVNMSEEGGRVFDVRQLEAGKEYYIIGMVNLETEGKVSFAVRDSDEEEYNQALQNNPFFEATDDEIVYTEISVGDAVEVEFAANDDEFETKDFVFTAAEDCTVVLYSEGSADACVYIADADGMTLHMSDDIPLFESSDFAVIGTVAKGETVCFSLTSFSSDGDSYTFSIVNEADYVPMS